jgi:hypothetical protein
LKELRGYWGCLALPCQAQRATLGLLWLNLLPPQLLWLNVLPYPSTHLRIPPAQLLFDPPTPCWCRQPV